MTSTNAEQSEPCQWGCHDLPKRGEKVRKRKFVTDEGREKSTEKGAGEEVDTDADFHRCRHQRRFFVACSNS